MQKLGKLFSDRFLLRPRMYTAGVQGSRNLRQKLKPETLSSKTSCLQQLLFERLGSRIWESYFPKLTRH